MSSPLIEITLYRYPEITYQRKCMNRRVSYSRNGRLTSAQSRCPAHPSGHGFSALGKYRFRLIGNRRSGPISNDSFKLPVETRSTNRIESTGASVEH